MYLWPKKKETHLYINYVVGTHKIIKHFFSRLITKKPIRWTYTFRRFNIYQTKYIISNFVNAWPKVYRNSYYVRKNTKTKKKKKVYSDFAWSYKNTEFYELTHKFSYINVIKKVFWKHKILFMFDFLALPRNWITTQSKLSEHFCNLFVYIYNHL